ncbi:MAG: hypothetical protein WCZ23_08205 [Rhodospirillaceae bacterium]
MSAEEVLDRFKRSQAEDFRVVIKDLEQPGTPLRRFFEDMRDAAGTDTPFARSMIFQPGGLGGLFDDLHDHVMAHPVWRHPFFVRVFEGRFDAAQLRTFALNYFNQVKNTRQCVTLAIARFHGLADLPYGPLAQPVSEVTQVVLAQLVADEYGVGTSGLDEYPSLDALFRSTTHMALYRRMLDAIGVPLIEQDVPLLPEVADNVLIQRLVAGDAAFTPLEALASVGLGMEWGVPEFFSLILGGIIRWADREAVPLTAHDLEIFIAHVKYDVLHAVSVMAATTLHMSGPQDVSRVKNAVNMLMSGRYGMMNGLYREVFGETLPGLREIGLDPRYAVLDHRMTERLPAARAEAAPGTVRDREAWLGMPVPFVFA